MNHRKDILETLVGGSEYHSCISFVCIGDPSLGSIDDPIIAILDSHSGSSTGIGSISRFTETKAPNVIDFSTPIVVGWKGKGGDPFVVLFGSSKGLDGVHVQRIVSTHDHTDRSATARNFFHSNCVRKSVESAPTVFFWGVDSHQSKIRQCCYRLCWEFVLLIPFGGVGCQFFVGEFPTHFVDHAGLLGQLGMGGDRSGRSNSNSNRSISSPLCHRSRKSRAAAAWKGDCQSGYHH
mmetsp:Transcript_7369/g.16648  ORF Transcript_7369/g.16648 Transcript_7369/m.16648 type:complete len:236 (+) Transcript_7369:847-1554(+)